MQVKVGLLAVALAVPAVLSAAGFAGDVLFIGGPRNTQAEAICSPLYENLMAEPGWGKVRLVRNEGYSGLPRLSKRDLEGVRLAIISTGDHYAMDQHDRKVLNLLVDYVRQGGGLVICNCYGQIFALPEFNYQLMAAFGGRVLMEKVCVPSGRGHRIGEYYPDTFTATDRVFPPFNDGVTNVLYCSYYNFNCDHGVVPFLPTKDWKVALSAGRDIASEPFPEMGLQFLDARRREKGFDGDTPIVGVREFGKGRVVWFGSGLILHRPIQSDATREIAERILSRGPEDGGPVETGRFIRNLFNWAGAHADQVDFASLPPLAPRREDDRRLGTDYRLFKGVVGPRTTFSSGRSTPEEYIARAKQLGLDFIAFLEDFESLTAEKFEKLREICAQATDDRFTAWPGYTFQKDDGNRQYVFSNEPIYPGRKWLTPDRKRFISMQQSKGDPARGVCGDIDISFFFNLLSFVNNHGWYMFHESPYRQTDNRNVQSMGVLTRIDGRTVETAFDAYKINCRNGQMLFPFALELMSSVDDLNERTYLSEVGMNGLAAFRRFMMVHGCHNEYPGEGNYGCQFVSNGPEIEFRPKRGDYGCDEKLLYSEMYADWPYTLKVTSANGLDWVEVVDGDRVIRHWDAKGEMSFERQGSFTVERQHYLWVRTKDRAGKAAFTRSCNSESFLMRENQCNDRNNQLFYSYQPRKGADGGVFTASYGADTCTPDKGPWNGRVRPVGFYVFDKKYGLGGDGGHDGSPEDMPRIFLAPSVNYGGEQAASVGWVRELVAGREGGAHCRPERVVSGGDVLVGDRVLDGVFAFDRRPIIHVWHSLFPVFDSAFVDSRARCTLFLPKVDGIVSYQWEQSLSLKQPIPTKEGAPFVNFGNVTLSTKCSEATACVSGERLENIASRRFSLRPGDYFIVKNPVFGSLAVFPLTPLDYDRQQLFVAGDGRVQPAGSTSDCRVVATGLNKFITDPYAFAGEVRKAYAIGGGTPVYQAALTAGSGHPNGVCFDAVASDGALAGTFHNLAKLPGTLGLRLSGMSSKRAAVVVSPSGVRVIPVEDGTAYAALREEESDCELFIGHPFVCENPDVVLGLSKPARKHWTLEIHNPTGDPIKTCVSSDKRCGAFNFERNLGIPAGSSIQCELQVGE